MYSSLCAMPLWVTPASAREAFIFTWAIEVFRLCLLGMGSGSLLGALPACRSLSGDAGQISACYLLTEEFGQRDLRSLENTSNWLKFPKPDSSDKCHKQEAEDKSGSTQPWNQ